MALSFCPPPLGVREGGAVGEEGPQVGGAGGLRPQRFPRRNGRGSHGRICVSPPPLNLGEFVWAALGQHSGAFPRPVTTAVRTGGRVRPREQGRDDGPRWSTSLPSSGPGPSSAPMWAGAAPGDAGVPRPRSGLSPRRQNRPRCRGTPPDRPARPELGDSGTVLEPDRPGRAGAGRGGFPSGGFRTCCLAGLPVPRPPASAPGWLGAAGIGLRDGPRRVYGAPCSPRPAEGAIGPAAPRSPRAADVPGLGQGLLDPTGPDLA